MADENFEVMISDKEYNQLKLNKQKNVDQQQAIKILQQKLSIATIQHQDLHKEMSKKDLEINYLTELIQRLTSGKREPELEGVSLLKSATFQILGQSDIQPQRADHRKKMANLQEFNKKYSNLINNVISLEERIDSQQVEIARLNKIKQEQKQSIGKQQAKRKEEAADLQVNLQLQIKELLVKLKQLQTTNNELKRQKIEQKTILEKQLQTADNNSRQSIEAFKKEIASIKGQNESLALRYKNSNQRIKDLETELKVLRNNAGNPMIKEQSTKNSVKALIDEYIREVEKSLKKIEGLSPEEVKQMLVLEMNELAEYIHKSIAYKK